MQAVHRGAGRLPSHLQLADRLLGVVQHHRHAVYVLQALSLQPANRQLERLQRPRHAMVLPGERSLLRAIQHMGRL